MESSMDTLGGLEERIRDLEAELARQRDIAAIAELKSLYCYYADGGWGSGQSTDAWLTLFTEDAVVVIRDAQGEPVEFTGRETLREWHRELPHHELLPDRFVAWHAAVNPIIEVDGDTARGRWHTITPLVDVDPEKSLVLGGVNVDEFVRTPDGWKISRAEHLPGFVGRLGASTSILRNG